MSNKEVTVKAVNILRKLFYIDDQGNEVPFFSEEQLEISDIMCLHMKPDFTVKNGKEPYINRVQKALEKAHSIKATPGVIDLIKLNLQRCRQMFEKDDSDSWNKFLEEFDDRTGRDVILHTVTDCIWDQKLFHALMEKPGEDVDPLMKVILKADSNIIYEFASGDTFLYDATSGELHPSGETVVTKEVTSPPAPATSKASAGELTISQEEWDIYAEGLLQLKEEMSNQESRIEDLAAQLVAVKEELRKAKEENASKDTSILSLETQLGDAKDEIADLESEVERLNPKKKDYRELKDHPMTQFIESMKAGKSAKEAMRSL